MNESYSILEQLKEKERFTDVEEQAVTYILDHTEDVSVMNISDLSAAAYTSNGTIIRICRKLGLKGYRDLKHALTKEIEAEKHVRNDVDFNTPFGTHQQIPGIMQSVAELYRESTELTLQALDWRAIRDAAQLLNQSRQIVLLATGDSMITAEMFRNRLVKIGIFAVNAVQYGDQHYIVRELNECDCAMLISYSGENSILKETIPSLKKNGVPLIAVTGSKGSSIDQAGDIRIPIPHKEGTTEEKIATFYSQVSFSMILNTLYSILYAMRSGNRK